MKTKLHITKKEYWRRLREAAKNKDLTEALTLTILKLRNVVDANLNSYKEYHRCGQGRFYNYYCAFCYLKEKQVFYTCRACPIEEICRNRQNTPMEKSLRKLENVKN